MAGLDHPDFAVPDNFEWLDTGQFDGVPTFQLGIGFRHSEHLRFDATAQYRAKSSFSALDRYEDTDDADPDTFDGTNHYTGKKEEWLFLANAYYDFNPIHGIVPYVGAGVGASYNTVYDFVDSLKPGDIIHVSFIYGFYLSDRNRRVTRPVHHCGFNC